MSWIQYKKVGKKCSRNIIDDNALSNDVVLDTLFGFLNGNDLKNCRLVCRKWNTKSESHFRKRSRIIFPPRKFGKRKSSKNMREFLKLFPHLQDDYEKSITAITLRGIIKESVLCSFFTSAPGLAIRDVEFQNIFLLADGLCIKDTLNIGQLVSKIKLRRLSIKPWNCFEYERNLKYFAPDLYGKPNASTDIVVDFSCLPFCEDIYLDCCTVVLDGVISPKRMQIKNCKIRSAESKHLSEVEVNLNNYVNFANCNEIIMNWSNEYGNPSAVLDMSSPNIKLKQLSITTDTVNANDWENAHWSIESLYLTHFPGKILNFGNLKFLSVNYPGEIDLVLLPNTIEKLHLGNNTPGNIRNTGCVANTLPNLKCLQIFSVTKADLSHFQNCKHLVDLDIHATYPYVNLTLNTDVVPASVRRLALTGFNIDLLSQERNIECLVVKYDYIEIHKHILKTLHPNMLISIGYHKHSERGNWNQENFNQMLAYTKMEPTIKTFIMGPLLIITSEKSPKQLCWPSRSMVCEEETGKAKEYEYYLYRRENDSTEKIEETEFKGYSDFWYDESDTLKWL